MGWQRQMNHQEKIFQLMEKPGFYPHAVSKIEHRETHISKVFLTGAYVYKIKKSVNLEFLDYTTLSKRNYYCHQETTLNRRLSHNIYLGVVAITFNEGRYYLSGPGKPVEYAVKMRQLPEDRSLIRMLKDGKIDHTAIDRLARMIADFYQCSATGGRITAFGSWETIHANCEENFRQMERFAGEMFNDRIFHVIRAATRSFLIRRRFLFQHRTENGKICDCHGDLRSGHIYFDDGIQIIDCIEFNERYRYSDMASDLAFLAMDLDFEGFPEIAGHLINFFAQYANDADMFVLIDFYKCYRALIRTKVNCLRLENSSIGDWATARIRREIDRYTDLAYGYALRFTRPTVWVVCGMPASGKSTISNELSRVLDIKVFCSDLVRKELFGIEPHDFVDTPFEKGIYSKGASSLTYGKLLLLAQEEIEKGASVILDATFSNTHQRGEALRLARDADVNIVFVECLSPVNLSKARLMKRKTGPSISDARLRHFEQFNKRFEPLNEIPDEIHVPVDTQRALKECIQKILSQDNMMPDRENIRAGSSSRILESTPFRGKTSGV
jgi:aminoglycoside phosphotransferase family enzyme/predicted kinase